MIDQATRSDSMLKPDARKQGFPTARDWRRGIGLALLVTIQVVSAVRAATPGPGPAPELIAAAAYRDDDGPSPFLAPPGRDDDFPLPPAFSTQRQPAASTQRQPEANEPRRPAASEPRQPAIDSPRPREFGATLLPGVDEQQQSGPAPPRTAPRQRPSDLADFSLRSETRTLGGAGGQGSISPYMIGDFFISGGQVFVGNPNGNSKSILAELPTGGGTRRVKISEDNSPIPRDRVFFNFNHFENAIPVPDPNRHDLSVERYTPGFEKTFFDGLGSIELRVPFALTQNPDINTPTPGADRATVFGNMTTTFKLLLSRTDDMALAAGFGLNLPTGPNVRLSINNIPTLEVRNQAVHIMPYIGALLTPDDMFFVQAYVQVDVDANGYPVETPTGNAGVLNDQTLLYTDISFGCWLYKNPDAYYVTGIAPIFEFHYTTTLQDADIVRTAALAGAGAGVGNVLNRIDVLNVTAGTQIMIGPKSALSIAGVFPIGRREANRQFDAEVEVHFNRFF